MDSINNKDVASASAVVAADFLNHNPMPGMLPDKDGMTQTLHGLLMAFPNAHIDTEQVLSNGDLVAFRVIAHGTHQAELIGVPATGKQISFPTTGIL